MFERFTDRARRVVVLAQEEARMLNHNYIGTEHLLLGLIHEGEGVAAKALESLGISLEAVRQQVGEIIGQGQQAPSGHIPFTPRAKRVLELSLREVQQLGHNYIGTEHILLGLIREGDGVAVQVLVKLGADLNRVRRQVIRLLPWPAEGNRTSAVSTEVPAAEATPLPASGGESRSATGKSAYHEQRAIVLALEEARMLNHTYVGTEHLLLGLIHEGDGVAAKALESLGISLEAVRQRVLEIIGVGEQAPSGHIPFTPRAKNVLDLSRREALQLGHNYIGTEHILLGLMREGDGVAAQVLTEFGADLNQIRQQLRLGR
jgi:ATP-dependent Clp protease ATP-binding subunit ClpA